MKKIPVITLLLIAAVATPAAMALNPIPQPPLHGLPSGHQGPQVVMPAATHGIQR